MIVVPLQAARVRRFERQVWCAAEGHPAFRSADGVERCVRCGLTVQVSK